MLDYQEERLRIRVEAAQRRARRRQFVEDAISGAEVVRATNTAEWVDVYAGEPPPAAWTALTALDKAEELREQVSRLTMQCRKRDEIIVVLLKAVAQLIEDDESVEVPE